MAKLSARGRTEVARYSKEAPSQDGMTVRRTKYAIMSDGKVLVEKSFRYTDGHAPDWANKGWQSSGWKIASLKHGLNADTLPAKLEELGWQKVAR